MPNPEQTRIERIAQLLKEFKSKNITTLDPIVKKTLEKYPHLREATAKTYAQAVYQILQTRKKEKDKEKATEARLAERPDKT
jgi:ribosomal silencing factor RsfS